MLTHLHPHPYSLPTYCTTTINTFIVLLLYPYPRKPSIPAELPLPITPPVPPGSRRHPPETNRGVLMAREGIDEVRRVLTLEEAEMKAKAEMVQV